MGSPAGVRLTQAERRTQQRTRGLWQAAGDQVSNPAAGSGYDSTYEALDLAVRTEPSKRTADDLTLLKAWVGGLQIGSKTVERNLNLDIVCQNDEAAEHCGASR